MALIDRVTERFTSSVLSAWTNPDEPETTTVDTTYLQRVCDDVEDAEFVPYMGEAYDESVRVHILAAVLLVRMKLIEYGAASNITLDKFMEVAEKRLTKYRNTRARDRISPQSSSQMTPSEEVAAGETKRPEFDPIFFQEIIPEDPGGHDPELD